MKKRLFRSAVGAIIGAICGMGTGIVGSFGGLSGLLVFSLIGGVFGFFFALDKSKLF